MSKSHMRRIAFPSLLAVGGLLAAACGSSGSSSSATTAAPATVSIGFFGALTGPNAQLGINIDDGVKLAVSQYNANASVKVSLVNLDSQGDPAQAPQLAQKAITDKLVAVVGPAFSGESLAADPILEQANIVSVTPSATNPALATHGWKFWHRIVGNDNAQGPAAAQFIVKKLGATKVAVIDDQSAYGQGIANIVRQALPGLGASIATSQSIDPTAPDYSSTVNAIMASGATAVFYGGYYDAAGRLLKQLRDAGYKAPFVTDDGSLDPKLITTAGQTESANTYATCACGDVSGTTAGKAFTSAYQTMFSTAPGTYSAEGYDAAGVILAAIKAGQTTSTGINTYIGSHSYNGITKKISFTSTGDINGGAIYVYQANGTAFTSLGLVSDLIG